VRATATETPPERRHQCCRFELSLEYYKSTDDALY
jgi:hypothetical protein